MFLLMSDLELGPSHSYLEHAPKLPAEEPELPLGLGQKLADRLAAGVGSWPFILVQSLTICLWVGANLLGSLAWDPYPFILLNLFLSFQAAYTGPIVLMSQNRLAERDRRTQANDYDIDRRAELEIEVIMRHLLHQDASLRRIEARLAKLQND